MPYKRTVQPVLNSLSVGEAKTQLVISLADDDTYLKGCIDDAESHFEDMTESALMSQSWELKIDRFSDIIDLPRPPLVSITSITYYDSDGVEQTLSTSVYDVDTYSRPGQVSLAYNQSWPAIRDIRNGITITYVAGYAAAANVPGSIRRAILLHVGHLYENREATSGMTIKTVPMAYDSLISPHKTNIL